MNSKTFVLITLQIFIVASIFPLTVLAQEDTVDEDQLIAELQALTRTQGDSMPVAQEPVGKESSEAEPQPEAETAPTMPEPQEEKADGEEHDAAEDILDLFGGDFEYAGAEAIEVPLATIEDTSVVIKTTQILYNGDPIDQYRVYYSTNTIADFLDVNDLKEMDLDVESTMGTTVDLSLEGLDPSTTYYLLVAPVDPTDPEADPLELISEEVTFETKATIPVPATTQPTLPTES
jgi:hypothetical protein